MSLPYSGRFSPNSGDVAINLHFCSVVSTQFAAAMGLSRAM
jgi:hypothetical protein